MWSIVGAVLVLTIAIPLLLWFMGAFILNRRFRVYFTFFLGFLVTAVGLLIYLFADDHLIWLVPGGLFFAWLFIYDYFDKKRHPSERIVNE